MKPYRINKKGKHQGISWTISKLRIDGRFLKQSPTHKTLPGEVGVATHLVLYNHDLGCLESSQDSKLYLWWARRRLMVNKVASIRGEDTEMLFTSCWRRFHWCFRVLALHCALVGDGIHEHERHEHEQDTLSIRPVAGALAESGARMETRK